MEGIEGFLRKVRNCFFFQPIAAMRLIFSDIDHKLEDVGLNLRDENRTAERNGGAEFLLC